MSPTTDRPIRPAWLSASDVRLDDLRAVVEQPTDVASVPFAHAIEQGVPIYDAAALREAMGTDEVRRAVLGELAGVFLDGPGIAVFAGAFPDRAVVDRVTAAFEAMIAEQHAQGRAIGDHYAKPGANDRVWNALEKLALADPEGFVDYYANDIIALAATAWLGPGYQITSQVNVVNPGGEAQQPHRDYHLGFLSDEAAAQFPAHVHHLSPALTLQGAVAHTDMPLESGPTTYLPHSQKYEAGYVAWRRPEVQAYFAEHRAQLPLARGDAVFFNPAVLHAAGGNTTTDMRRMGNLLQISSALGRAMETMDRAQMCRAVYPVLLARKAEGAPDSWLRHALAATAEGYPFPTSLDRDPPIGGLAPPSQADEVWRAVVEGWAPERLDEMLTAHAGRRATGSVEHP